MFRMTAAALVIASASPAFAEVKTKAPDRLEFQYSAEVAAPRAKVWAKIVKPGTWWSDAHTYSGKASNLRLTEKAGGCWCEIWAGGQVEHGRVVTIMPNQMLRLDSALGPLQDMGVSGALTFTLAQGASENTTKITLDYKVSGSSALKLDALATVVDGVIGEQFAALSKGW